MRSLVDGRSERSAAFRARVAEIVAGRDPSLGDPRGWNDLDLGIATMQDARDLAARVPSLTGEARAKAVWLLSFLRDRRVVPTLIDVFLSDADVRFSAASGLASLGGERAKRALLAALVHDDPSLRETAAYALNYAHDKRAVEPLRERAADPRESVAVRAQAVESLGGIYMCDRRRTRSRERTVALLLRLLDAPEVELVFWASYAVGVMRVRRALPRLDEIRRTDTRTLPMWWSLAEEAEWAMATIRGRPDPEGFPRTRDVAAVASDA